MDMREKTRLSPFNYFFTRVLQSSSITTYELCQLLEIPDIYQEIIWNLVKSMLSCEPHLLINRHLDQILMCTIYSVVKISDLRQITFNHIITQYAQLFKFKRYIEKIYQECVVDEESGETKNIIQFYNEVYLRQMKAYILVYKEQARNARNAAKKKAPARQARTPGGIMTTPLEESSVGPMLTPIGARAFVKAFCPKTPLKSNFPPKVHTRVVF